jgi:pyridoxine 4-dehydrogenase
LKAALNNGLTLWNGAEFYGTPDCNSMTLLKAYFTKYPEDADKVTLVIKGGMDLDTHRPDGSPKGTRRSLDNIINSLGGTKKLDGFAPSRRDPNTPLAVTYGVIQQEYINTGKLGAVYISECSADTIREASKFAKIGAAEVEMSMFSPDILTNGVAEACFEHNIPILAYAPIGRGVSSRALKTSPSKKQYRRESLSGANVQIRCSRGDSRMFRTSKTAASWFTSLGSNPQLLNTIFNSSTRSRRSQRTKAAALLN